MSGTSSGEQAEVVHGRRVSDVDQPATSPSQSDLHTEPADSPTAEPHSDGAYGIPEPTVWPATLAFGISLVAASFATSTLVALAGAALMIVALLGWIQELLADAAREPGKPGHGEDHG